MSNFLVLAALAFLSTSASAQRNNTGFSDYHGKLSLNGPQIVNQYGEPVQLMGMSSHGLQWFPNCYTKESISFLVESWGINLFRPALYIGEGGYQQNPQLKNTVQNIVQWCKELGIYVLIDWHVLTPGDPNYWLTQPGHSNALTFWTEMARLYKDEKHVLYELANEPNGVQWSAVKSYHDTVIPAIRQIDPQTIIIAGTTTWSQDIDQAAANPVAMPYNVMYSFHFYSCSHAGLMSRFVQYSQQIPVFITEWGSSGASGDGGPCLDVSKSYLDAANNVGGSGITVSSAQWSYADKAEISASLNPDACGGRRWDDVSQTGSWVRDYIRANVQGGQPAAPTPPPAPTPAPAPTSAPPSTGCKFCWDTVEGCGYWCERAWNEGCAAVGCTTQECGFC